MRNIAINLQNNTYQVDEYEGDVNHVLETDESNTGTRNEPNKKKQAASDLLTLYLLDIQRYKMLTRREEKKLAIRVREQKDQDAAHKLVTSNLRLVVKIAKDFHWYKTTSLMDLIQEGNLGLLQSVRKFDPYRGTKFSYYASFWIKAYVLKHVMDNWDLIKSEVSISFPESWAAVLPDPGMALDDHLSAAQSREMLLSKLEKCRNSLQGREADIFDNRIMAENPKSLSELGEKHQVSREWVRQLQKKIVGNIKKCLREEIPNFGEEYATLLNFVTRVDDLCPRSLTFSSSRCYPPPGEGTKPPKGR